MEAVPNLNPLKIVISLTAMILESQITRQSLELFFFCPYSRNDLRENYILRLWWFCKNKTWFAFRISWVCFMVASKNYAISHCSFNQMLCYLNLKINPYSYLWCYYLTFAVACNIWQIELIYMATLCVILYFWYVKYTFYNLQLKWDGHWLTDTRCWAPTNFHLNDSSQ